MIAIVTEKQADELKGHQYCPDSYFNPIQLPDPDFRWFISSQEVELNENEKFEWVNKLPLIPYPEQIKQ